jgi:hypothetical protein
MKPLNADARDTKTISASASYFETSKIPLWPPSAPPRKPA